MVTTSHRLDFPAILIALWRLGCIVIPFEETVTPAELKRALDTSAAHWLISENPAHLFNQLRVVRL
ncbi:MAG: hypothetical protein KatS3mg057_1022 [Herpetosiphonaceae bacterium]|nr:MAG: hypothetical protein KatS3mg057_1022 [Herpetosiphonaceae bacterium]